VGFSWDSNCVLLYKKHEFRPVHRCIRPTAPGSSVHMLFDYGRGLLPCRSVISHKSWNICKLLTETSRMRAGSCDLVTLVRKWLHQNVGSANQCELLHFCTITQLAWPRVVWGQVYKSGSIQTQLLFMILCL